MMLYLQEPNGNFECGNSMGTPRAPQASRPRPGPAQGLLPEPPSCGPRAVSPNVCDLDVTSLLGKLELTGRLLLPTYILTGRAVLPIIRLPPHAQLRNPFTTTTTTLLAMAGTRPLTAKS